jgi:hypothetical protein
MLGLEVRTEGRGHGLALEDWSTEADWEDKKK